MHSSSSLASLFYFSPIMSLNIYIFVTVANDFHDHLCLYLCRWIWFLKLFFYTYINFCWCCSFCYLTKRMERVREAVKIVFNLKFRQFTSAISQATVRYTSLPFCLPWLFVFCIALSDCKWKSNYECLFLRVRSLLWLWRS